LSPEIAGLLHLTQTPAFSLESLDFIFVPYYSRPGKNIYYTVRHGDITIADRIICVDCVLSTARDLILIYYILCGQRFAYYCSNYAIVLVPSRTSSNKILYVRHYNAEIRGKDSRTCHTCRQCIWDMEDPRMLYNVGCQRPNPCTCILCSKEPPTLKSLASKFCFPINTTYDCIPPQIPCEKYNIL